jgi:hypothetical protein
MFAGWGRGKELLGNDSGTEILIRERKAESDDLLGKPLGEL